MASCAAVSPPRKRSRCAPETSTSSTTPPGPVPGTRRRLVLARSLGELQQALCALRRSPDLRVASAAQLCNSVALRRATARVHINVANLFARLPDCSGSGCVYGDRRWRVRVNGRQLYLQQAMALLCDDTLAASDAPFRIVSRCAPPPRCDAPHMVPDNHGTPRPTAATDMVCVNPAHFVCVQFEADRAHKRKRSVLETGRVVLNSDAGPVECALSERMRFEHFYMQAPIAGRRRRAGRRAWAPAPRPARDRQTSTQLKRPHYTCNKE